MCPNTMERQNGATAAFETMRPVAMAFSRAITLLGESGAGQLAKIDWHLERAGVRVSIAEAVAHVSSRRA